MMHSAQGTQSIQSNISNDNINNNNTLKSRTKKAKLQQKYYRVGHLHNLSEGVSLTPCCSVGTRELILVFVVRLVDLRIFGFVCFLFHLVSEKGCGL